MFPKEAHFICRTCRARFFFDEAVLVHVSRDGKFGCSGCSSVTTLRPNDVERFFKFYPRMTLAIEAMERNGFRLVDYAYEKSHLAAWYSFKRLTWSCMECGKTFAIPFSRIDKLAREPRVFSCPKCRINPKIAKISKEFFVCLKNTHDAASLIHEFQWDIFSPLQQEPPVYEIQYPVYRESFP